MVLALTTNLESGPRFAEIWFATLFFVLDFDGFDVNELWADSEEEKKPLKKRSKNSADTSKREKRTKNADSSQRAKRSKNVDPPQTEFPCDQCDKVLRSRNSLNIHRKRNHCENLFEKEVSITLDCEICTKKVSIFNVYTHHVRKEAVWLSKF